MAAPQRIGLYVLLDRALVGGRDAAALLRPLLDAGARWFQWRDKRGTDAEVAAELARLGPLCRAAGARLIVNDRAPLAAPPYVDGVHLGASDIATEEARRILGPGKIIGRSARTVGEALRARDEGADYIGAGAVRPTATKGDAAAIGVAGIAEICRVMKIPPPRRGVPFPPAPPAKGEGEERGVDFHGGAGGQRRGLPVVAIGGIARADVGELLAAGASGIAVGSAILLAPDPAGAARGFIGEIERYDAGHGGRSR